MDTPSPSGSFSPDAYKAFIEAYANEAKEPSDTNTELGIPTETMDMQSPWLEQTGLWKYPNGVSYQSPEELRPTPLAPLAPETDAPTDTTAEADTEAETETDGDPGDQSQISDLKSLVSSYDTLEEFLEDLFGVMEEEALDSTSTEEDSPDLDTGDQAPGSGG